MNKEYYKTEINTKGCKEFREFTLEICIDKFCEWDGGPQYLGCALAMRFPNAFVIVDFEGNSRAIRV